MEAVTFRINAYFGIEGLCLYFIRAGAERENGNAKKHNCECKGNKLFH
jgi:hypothetical protein